MNSFAATGGPGTPRISRFSSEYQSGVCNIGPEEIARRRRAGHVGVVVTVGLLVALIAIGAPPLLRLVLFIPAAMAASGYLQAWLKFCAGFGRLGRLQLRASWGNTARVEDEAARAADRRRANQIGLASGLIGLAVAVVAVLLPIGLTVRAGRPGGFPLVRARSRAVTTPRDKGAAHAAVITKGRNTARRSPGQP